jgi:hypothetical protein
MCVKIKCTNAERGSLDASVCRFLCEEINNFDEWEIEIRRYKIYLLEHTQYYQKN